MYTYFKKVKHKNVYLMSRIYCCRCWCSLINCILYPINTNTAILTAAAKVELSSFNFVSYCSIGEMGSIACAASSSLVGLHDCN